MFTNPEVIRAWGQGSSIRVIRGKEQELIRFAVPWDSYGFGTRRHQGLMSLSIELMPWVKRRNDEVGWRALGAGKGFALGGSLGTIGTSLCALPLSLDPAA
jgi:hypothetical protein